MSPGGQPHAGQHRLGDGDAPLGVAMPSPLPMSWSRIASFRISGFSQLVGDPAELRQARIVRVALRASR